MFGSPGTIALTTPEDVKQASLLYERIALLEAEAPLGFTTTSEERRAFDEWCIQRVVLKPDEAHRHLDYRDPRVLWVGGEVLRQATRLCDAYSGEFIVSLLPGYTDVADDLREIGVARTVEPDHDDVPSGITRILISDAGLVDADRVDWRQIREFRRDDTAKAGYRGILAVHRILEQAQSEAHARELLDILLQKHNEARTKHALPIGGQSVIQLVAGLSASAFAYAAGNPESFVVTGLGTIAAATYNLLSLRQERKRSEAPALLVKVRGFLKSGDKSKPRGDVGRS